MKYLKYLENFEEIDIKVGKYFLVSTIRPTAIMEQIHKVKSKLMKILNYNVWKYDFLILGDDDDFYRLTLSENNIIRELTPEEIDEFESKIEANKYNL